MRKIVLFTLCIVFLSGKIAGQELFLTGANDYVDSSGNIHFQLNRNHLLLSVKNGEQYDAWIDILGPLFPGYNSSVCRKVQQNLSDSSVTAEQYSDQFAAKVYHRIKPFKGGFLVRSSWNSNILKPEEAKKIRHRLIFRIKEFAGKKFKVNNVSQIFPIKKSPRYELASGTGACELRVNVNATTDIVFQYDSTLGRYQLADCRYHSEDRYHFYTEYTGNELSYKIFILKKDEPVPVESMNTASKPTGKRNLLNPGSGFEVGRCGMFPQTVYAYSEEHLPEASRQPYYSTQRPHSGKYCLELTMDDVSDAREKFSRAVFLPIRLDPNKTYTLSAWFRSDTPGMKAVLATQEPTPGAQEEKKTFSVDSSWKRYCYTFRPEKFKVLNYRLVMAGIAPEVKKGVLCVDDVQLEEGKSATEYQAAETEFSAVIEDEYAIYEQEKLSEGKITLRFNNNKSVPECFKINYRLLDYNDREIDSGKMEEKLGGGENRVKFLRYPQLPCGYYRMIFESPDRKYRDEAIFIVYRQLEHRGLLPLNWPLGHSNGECTPYIRKLGFGSVRTWSAPFFRIMPKENLWNFSSLDIVVQRAASSRTNVFPILGPRFDWTFPAWTRDTLKSSPEGSSWQGGVSFPRQDIWRKYVRGLAERYKDSIRVWEVLNEPNCFITPEDYIPYLRSAYEEIKSVNPSIMVVGGCATSDFGLAPASWTKKMLQLDRAKHLDIVSIHMYSSSAPELTYEHGTQWADEVIREAALKFQRDLPVWHTEKSFTTTSGGYSLAKTRLPPVYIRNQYERIRYRVKDFREVAEFLIRQTLLDAVAGKGVFFWFGLMPNRTYKAIYQFELMHHEFDMSPAPQLAAANGLARMLEKRHIPVKLLKLGGTALAAIFRGERGTMAAIWDYGSKSRQLTLPEHSDELSLYDFFGEPISRFDGHSVTISSAPVYLTSSARDSEVLMSILQKAVDDASLFSIHGWYQLKNNRPAIFLEFNNLGTTMQKLKLDINPGNQLLSLEKNHDEFSCNAGETVVRCVPVNTENIRPGEPELLIQTEKDKSVKVKLPPVRSTEHLYNLASSEGCVEAVHFQTSPTVDGSFEEWPDGPSTGLFSPKQLAAGRKPWQSWKDLSAEVRFGYDDKALYLAAEIYDDALVRTYPARDAYYSDALELFLSPDKFPKIRQKGKHYPEPTDFQFIFAPGDPAGEFPTATVSCPQASSQGKHILVASQPSAHGYRLEASIPWKLLGETFIPIPRKVLPMTFQIRDTDQRSTSAAKCMTWTGGTNNFQAPWNWGKLILSTKTAKGNR